jgi:tetratricopeptide (TPR) repeat protein
MRKLEHFRFTGRHLKIVQGGFFLRKKPLRFEASLNGRLENAVAGQLRRDRHRLLLSAAFGAALACCVPVTFPQQASPSDPDHPPALSVAQEEPRADPALAEEETKLRKALERNPEKPADLYQLGLVLRQENKPQDSLQVYTRAAHLLKPNADQLRSVALDYVLLNDYSDAIHWLRIALTFDPNNVDVLYSLGRCLYTQSSFPQAQEAFTRVLELQPEHLKAEENLGLTLDAQNQPEAAEKALRTAAAWADQRSPQDEWPFLDLGNFLLDRGRQAEALPFLLKAAHIAPGSAATHEKLGRALVATGKPDDGINELQAAARLDPKNPKIHFELGHAYRDAGKLDQARAEFALSKKLYGEHSND